MTTLHIKAVGDLRAPFLDASGRPVAGRFAGRARKTFEPLADGEHVADVADYRRAIARGDLALVGAPIDVPTAIEPMVVIDLGSRLPVIDLGKSVVTKPVAKEHAQ